MEENDKKRELWPGWVAEKTLGRGSYGSVYQIERTIPGRTQKEQAALKVMSIPQSQEDIQELTSQGYDRESITKYYKEQLDELIREYAIMLELKGHTNIVYCDELKWTPHDDGIGWNVYIKMELLRPLKSVLGNSYNEHNVIQLGKDIARALIRCKEKNIIHRDIKPQNILVSSKGDYKLGDFGVAKVSEKTAAGTIAGTYEYMAPEVFRGEKYNSTADIYSLGIVMYWMMNNKRTPFLPQPPDIPSSSDTETARTKRFSGVTIPEPFHGSSSLKEIVLKACAFSPQNRYQSPQELLEDLEALQVPASAEVPEKKQQVKTVPKRKKKNTSGNKHSRRFIPVAVGILVLVCAAFSLFFGRRDAAKTAVQTKTTEPVAYTQTVPVVTEPAAEPIPSAEAPAKDRRWENNVFKGYESGNIDRYPEPVYGTDITKNQIIGVTFLDSLANAPSSVIDVSEAGDGSVMAWFSPSGNGFEMFIAGEGGVNGKNTYKLFINYENLERVRFNGNFHTDSAESMYDMFLNCKSLTDVDISTLNTSNVRDMNNMFASCSSLKELDLSGLETGNVTNFSGMFRWCGNLQNVDVSTWDTTSAEDMCVMFQSCMSLRSLDLSSFDTSNVTAMSNMFTDCQNLKDLNVSNFDTAKVSDFSRMFYNCYALQDVKIRNFDISSMKTYESFMPVGKKINGEDWKKHFTDKSLHSWKKNVLRNDYGGLWDNPMFGTEIKKEQIVAVTFLDSVKDAPSSCIDVSQAGDGSVLAWVSGYDDTYELFIAGEGGVCAPENCQWMFGYYTNCRQFNLNGNFHTDYVKDMSNFFYGCSALETIDISTLNTSNAENLAYMFGACSGLTDLDLRTMDTASARNLYGMFIFCSNLKSVDMRTWDTSKAETMGWMFYHCTSLETLDLSNFDTASVTEFYRMFSGCTKLRSVDLSSFHTSAAEDMTEMFNECPMLEEIDLSHFDVSNVQKFNKFMNQNKTVNGEPWLKMFR